MDNFKYLKEKCIKAKAAGQTLAFSSGEMRNKALIAISQEIMAQKDYIIAQNKIDVENGKAKGMRESLVDRLTLNEQRLQGIANAMVKVVGLADPLGKGSIWTCANGLKIEKVQVPIGVIGMIYEARPNVTADAAALAIKSGNTVILRGGSEAVNSNLAMVKAIRKALENTEISPDCVQIIENTSRELATQLMKMRGYLDLLIPRGNKPLIESVVNNATVPVIETGAGNCHIYVDEFADLKMAEEIAYTAKTSRPSVCNSAETLLVHNSVAKEFLPMINKRMSNVELRGCEKTLEILPMIKKAEEEDFYTEYNDYIMAVKVVENVQEAVEHINKYNTKHSEAIVTNNTQNADYFTLKVDAAAVYVNASTRYTDGEEFGFGAEIGISTQKYHARGPVGLDELTTVKYKIHGNGQVR